MQFGEFRWKKNSSQAPVSEAVRAEIDSYYIQELIQHVATIGAMNLNTVEINDLMKYLNDRSVTLEQEGGNLSPLECNILGLLQSCAEDVK